MAYKALTYINIPPNNRKAPGDTITEKEFADADPKQGEAEIKQLLDSKAISKNMDAPIDKAHAPVVIPPSANTQSIDVVSGDIGIGGDNNA
jgi:hypothetical protein